MRTSCWVAWGSPTPSPSPIAMERGVGARSPPRPVRGRGGGGVRASPGVRGWGFPELGPARYELIDASYMSGYVDDQSSTTSLTFDFWVAKMFFESATKIMIASSSTFFWIVW